MRLNKWLGNWKAINFTILAGLNYLDYLTTKIILLNGGKEANPLMDYIIVHNGIDHVLLFKAFALIIVLASLKWMSVRLLILLNTVYLFVVLNNTYLIGVYT
jgi:hypothetical protein